MPPRRPNTLVIAILIAGAIIAGAIYVTRRDNNNPSALLPTGENNSLLDAVRPVEADDHVWGNPNAPIVLVTYSDFSCPFCKEYHQALHQVIDLYGRDGKIAWVFRHIPIVQMHAEAPMYALASECVAKHGGNQAFWTFSDALFAAIDVDVKPGTEELLTLAEQAGIERQIFTSCMRENALMEAVEEDFDEAVAAGAQASPFTVVIAPDGRSSFEGSRPFSVLGPAIKIAVDAVGATELRSPSEAYDATRFPQQDTYDDTTDDQVFEDDSLVPSVDDRTE